MLTGYCWLGIAEPGVASSCSYFQVPRPVRSPESMAVEGIVAEVCAAGAVAGIGALTVLVALQPVSKDDQYKKFLHGSSLLGRDTRQRRPRFGFLPLEFQTCLAQTLQKVRREHGLPIFFRLLLGNRIRDLR